MLRQWIMRVVAAGALAAAVSSNASATTVNLAGTNYVYNSTVFCQAQPGGGPLEFGKYVTSVGLAVFNTTTVGVQSILISGPLAAIEPLSGQYPNVTYPFSNTSTTLTIGNVTYQVQYNGINLNTGVPTSIVGVGLDPQGCAHSFSAQILQTSGATATPAGQTYAFNHTMFCQVGGAYQWGKNATSTGFAIFGASSVQVSTSVVSGNYIGVDGALSLSQPTQTYSWSIGGNAITGFLTIGSLTYFVIFDNTGNNGPPGNMWGLSIDANGCAHTITAQLIPPQK